MDMHVEMPPRDGEGYLVEPDDWSDAVAAAIAGEMDIELTDDHWDVIRYMREFFDENRVAADARFVIKHLDDRYPAEGRRRLFDLFPYGYVAQACKIAGMKRPRGWSTG